MRKSRLKRCIGENVGTVCHIGIPNLLLVAFRHNCKINIYLSKEYSKGGIFPDVGGLLFFQEWPRLNTLFILLNDYNSRFIRLDFLFTRHYLLSFVAKFAAIIKFLVASNKPIKAEIFPSRACSTKTAHILCLEIDVLPSHLFIIYPKNGASIKIITK